MVYQGPSKACVNCRQRRRKCDGKEPACSLCVRTNKPCIRFEHSLDSVLRNESAKVTNRCVEKNALQLRKQRQQPISLVSRTNPDTMSLDAVIWFLATHAPQATDLESCHGYLEFLQPVFLDSPGSSPLVHATTAVAVFLQEAWLDLYPRSPRTRKYLGRALKSVNEALADPKESLKDSTLVAVLLLDLHDSFSNMVSTSLPDEQHFAGVMALIEHRGHRNYETEMARRLMNAVRHQVLNYANAKGFTVDKATRIWAEDNGSTALLPRNKATDLDLLNLRLNGLKVKTLSLATGSSPGAFASLPTQIYDLFKEVQDLEIDFQQWYNTIPDFWRPLRIKGAIEFDTYRGYCDLYYDMNVARVINEYRLSRAALLTWLIQLTSMGGGFWYEKGSQARIRFQNVVDEMCDSVAFYIGNRFSAEGFDDPSFRYPRFPNPEDHEKNRNNAIQATAFGGTLLLGVVRGILDLVAACPVADPSLLREGQPEWLKRQLLRIAVMYRFRLPQDESSEAVPPLIAEWYTPEAEKQPAVEMIGLGWNFRL